MFQSRPKRQCQMAVQFTSCEVVTQSRKSPSNSGFPAYSGPPAYGYQSRPLYSPYPGSGDGYPVAGERPSEYRSPGAEYGVEPAS